MPANVTPGVTISLDTGPIPADRLRDLRSVEVEASVHEQAAFRVKLGMGQDATGDWAKYAERTFLPMQSLRIDARVGNRPVRLINGLLTQLKMNFKADPCESELELTGFDALEKLKRSHTARGFRGHSVASIVTQVFSGKVTPPDTTKIPNGGTTNPTRDVIMQAHDDLEFLRTLADTARCEVYVEPVGDTDQAHFEPLDLGNAPAITASLNVNQGGATNVRNAQFYYDLSGPTAVEAAFVDAGGHAGAPVRKSLSELVGADDKALFGPPGFENVRRLERHGRETQTALLDLCATELEKLAWVVIGKGELETQAFGEVLVPRHRAEVKGAASSFNGWYLVWKVTHSFSRDLYCQRFELRRKLSVSSL